MNLFFWQCPPNIFVCHIHATTTFYAVTSTKLTNIRCIWYTSDISQSNWHGVTEWILAKSGNSICSGSFRWLHFKRPKFLCKYWARDGWSKCSFMSCVTLPLLMDVLLHLEFLNPQVQRTPTSSECPQPLVPQVGGLNQVQLESREGHSQTFASPPLHVLWPARIGPVPWGSLYLGTLWWEEEWQYFHQVPLV